jgi:hypothetical protein
VQSTFATQPVDACGRCHGEVRSGTIHVLVMMLDRVERLDLSVQQCTCKGCDWQSFDGAECCILRFCGSSCKALFPDCPTNAEPEIAFHWSLLYSSCEELYKSQQWRGTWDRLCKNYGNTWHLPKSQQQALLKIHHYFRAAVMDFIDLQRLPYREVLRCRCERQYRKLVADGICLGPRLRNQYIVMPCHPPMADDTPVKHGSKHSERMLLRNDTLRQLMFQLSLWEGLTGQEHAKLQELAHQHCAGPFAQSLLRITTVTGHPSDHVLFDGDKYTARDAVKVKRGVQPSASQQLFHELGCNSPACGILRLKCCADLHQWRQQVLQKLHAGDTVPPNIAQSLDTLAPNLMWVFKGVNRLLIQAVDTQTAGSDYAKSMCEALLVVLEHLEQVCSTAMSPH